MINDNDQELLKQLHAAPVDNPAPSPPPVVKFDKVRRDHTPAIHRRNVRRVASGAVAIAPRPSAYTVGGKTLAEGSAFFLWLALWLFNGVCTTLAWLSFVNWLAAKLHYSGVIMEQWFQAIIGFTLHVFISTVEQHLWRELDQTVIKGLTIRQRIARLFGNVRVFESVIVGAIDSATTARVLLVVLGWFGLSGLTATVHAAWIGTALALVCEPMLRLHADTLIKLIRGPQRRNK